jgi:diguanylate cyclase (GGDEF)-like protein
MPVGSRRYIALLSVAAGLCLAVAAAAAVHTPLGSWWHPVVFIGLFVAAELPWLEVRVGSDKVIMTWSEAAVAAGLVLLPAPWVPLAVACGALLVALLERRKPIKTAFNIAMYVVGSAIAASVATLLTHNRVALDAPRHVLAVLLAGVVFGLWTDAATAVVVALVRRIPVLEVYRAGVRLQMLSAVGNLIGAAIALGLYWIDPRGLAVVPALLVCLRQAYVGQLRGQKERDSWEHLLRATQTLADLDERIVLSRGVTAAAQLFSAEWVEVEYGNGRMMRGTAQAVVYEGAAGDAPSIPTRTQMIGPLGLDTSPLGAMRLCFSGEVTLDDRERAMLRAVAAELHSALVNARQHAKARHEATHDPLTDLLNRAGLLEAGRPPLLSAAAGGVDAAVVLVDLTGFREIVDTLGHIAGDSVLNHTARRLRAAAMPGELLARLDSDDFMLLLPRLTDPAQASHRAETLLGALAEPVEIDGASLSISGVAGIAYAVRGSVALEELLRQAGVAVHAVRAGSGGRVGFYAPERDAGSVTRLVLASELRTALRDMEQLELLYQPIVDLHSGEAVGAEALVRWNHPTRGQLGPQEFLPVVEHAGLLPELTRRVFDIALESAAEWSRHGIEVPVAVDVSPRTLVDRDFPGQLAAALSRHRVPPSRLTLEITETSVLTHLDVVNRVLDELRELGVRLALDRFGEGYSSLSRLSRVKVHEVKLAPDFADSLFTSAQAAAVVRGTLEIARALDLQVVAEGVSTAMQRATLVSLGCHAGQGPHFFPPLSGHKIGPALWSSAVRAMAVSEGADVIPLSQRRTPRRES